jgi:hypothetical protein
LVWMLHPMGIEPCHTKSSWNICLDLAKTVMSVPSHFDSHEFRAGEDVLWPLSPNIRILEKLLSELVGSPIHSFIFLEHNRSHSPFWARQKTGHFAHVLYNIYIYYIAMHFNAFLWIRMHFFGFVCISMYIYVFVGILNIENRIQPKRCARRECRGAQPTWVYRTSNRVQKQVHFEPAQVDEKSVVQNWLFCTSSEAVPNHMLCCHVYHESQSNRGFLLLKGVQECSCVPELMPWVFKLAEVLQNQGKWTNDWTSKFQLHRSPLLRAGFWLPSWNRFSSIQSRCWSSVLASHSNHSKGYADWFWSNLWAPTESRLLYREAAMRSMWEDSPSMPQLIWGVVVSPESSIYALPSPRGASGFKFSDFSAASRLLYYIRSMYK